MLINRAIFIESTLSQEEIKPFVHSSDLLLPSIMRGDLIKLYSSYTSIKEVIIVDGVFEQHPSITHKEILWLLSKGVKIVGIGSLGALRAYELRNEGMLGFGWVYEQFFMGYVDGDDEVAVAYDPKDPANSKTLAMINFRKTIENNPKLKEYLSIIKEIHFRERTWKTLSKQLPGNIKNIFRANYTDVKKEDVLNFFNPARQIEKQKQKIFVPNIYFSSFYLNHLNLSVIQYIRLKLQEVNYIELPYDTFYRERYNELCKFLGLSPNYISRIAFVLDKLLGIRLHRIKIKQFTYKLQTELNLHTPQSVRELFENKGVSQGNINSLLENLTKLYDYFLCTSS